MFNVLTINDWHAIAEVYRSASRNSEPYIVYPFFVTANLVCVSIMLNCVTAFFVGAFVAKLEEEDGAEHSEIRLVDEAKPKEFQIDTSSQSVRRISSYTSLDEIGNDEGSSSLNGQPSPEVPVEFDVYERPTYDKIIRTVSGVDYASEVYAKDIFEKLVTFQSLTPTSVGVEVGFLTYCQQSMNRYGNGRFEAIVARFMEIDEAHTIASRLHAQLMLGTSSHGPSRSEAETMSTTYPNANGKQQLTIKVSLIRQNPPVSLLVASVMRNNP